MSAPTTYQQIRPADENQPRDHELPPALVEAIHDSPEVMQPMARVYAARVLHEMFKESGAYTPGQKRDFLDICTRLGDLDPKKRQEEKQAGAGFTINITIPGQPTSGVTVQGEATAIALTDE